MKKSLFICLLLAIAGIMVTGCDSCQSENNKQEGYDGVVVDFNKGVEHIQAQHRQMMYGIAKGKKYAWYESKVMFRDSIKADNLDDVHMVDVTDVFQTFEPALCQTISTNIKKGTIVPSPIPDIWIEDVDMSELPLKITAEDVIEKLKAWDGIIPPAKGMTLRCPLGPRRCNAQWVIGNIKDVIFIDAVTGNITDWCPAFPDPRKNGPLGEWP